MTALNSQSDMISATSGTSLFNVAYSFRLIYGHSYYVKAG